MFFKWQDDDLILNVRVQPRAASDAFAEHNDEYIKTRITAAPVDGKANKHLIALLAKTFKVSKSSVTLLSGESSREKRILVQSPKVLPETINRDE